MASQVIETFDLMHEAKVSDFLVASWQDKLEEATNELFSRYSHRSIPLLFTGLDQEAVAPTDP